MHACLDYLKRAHTMVVCLSFYRHTLRFFRASNQSEFILNAYGRSGNVLPPSVAGRLHGRTTKFTHTTHPRFFTSSKLSPSPCYQHQRSASTMPAGWTGQAVDSKPTITHNKIVWTVRLCELVLFSLACLVGIYQAKEQAGGIFSFSSSSHLLPPHVHLQNMRE